MRFKLPLFRSWSVTCSVLWVVLLPALLLFAAPVRAQSQGFWVWNGQSMMRVVDDDGTQFKALEWQVWLYDQGKPTGGNDYWGLLRGSSSQAVMEKLKREQDTELSTNNYFGKGRVPSQVMTYFNSFGPIAIVDRPQPAPRPTAKPVPGAKPTPKPAPLPKPEPRWGDPDYHLGDDFLDDDLRGRRDAVRKAWDDILSGKGDLDNARNVINGILHDAGNPFSGVGNVLGEVIGTYIDAAYKLKQAQRMLDQANNPALAGIDDALGEFWTDIDSIDAGLRSAQAKLEGSSGEPAPVQPLPAAPAPAPQPETPNSFRPILGQRFLSKVSGVDSYEVYARFDIRNGNLEYDEEFGGHFDDGGGVTIGDTAGDKRIVATIPLSVIDPNDITADDDGMNIYTTAPVRYMWEINEQNRQSIPTRFPRTFPNGSTAKSLLEDFKRLIQEAKDGKTSTAPAPAASSPTPKPQADPATAQMKQQLLTAIDAMRKQIAQLRARQEALKTSPGALVAPNIPAPVARDIQAAHDKFLNSPLASVIEGRFGPKMVKKPGVFWVEDNKPATFPAFLAHLAYFDSIKRDTPVKSVKVVAHRYVRSGSQETLDLTFSLFGHYPGNTTYRNANESIRETWNVLPGGARELVKATYLGGNKTDIEWQPPSVTRLAEAKEHALSGYKFNNEKQWSEAETEFRKALDLNPNGENGQYQNSLCIALSWLNKNEEEQERLMKEAIRLDPENNVFHDNFGTYLYNWKRYAEAETEYREAIRLSRNDASYHADLGNTLFSLGKYGQAEEQYREAIGLDPKSGRAYANLASALRQQNNIDEARKMAQKAIELGYKDHWVYKELGLTP